MISIKNISKSYKDVKALNDFSYDFGCGIYAILGPNGSGKSTLMNIMTDNVSPDSGSISFSEKNGTSKSRDQKIGYIPQYPGMYPNFTVYEMLDYVAILNKAENREMQIRELMTVFDLNEYTHKKIRALSGGTRQRLAIAQGFIGHPELVILDEPTAGLDPVQRVAFKNFIAEQKGKMTIIISTHIVSDVEEVADEVIFLKRGVIVKAGTLEHIIKGIEERCWRVESLEQLGSASLYRMIGGEIRVISDRKPSESAVLVEPTLEECYLEIFGMG